jgi:hypothetical protein
MDFWILGLVSGFIGIYPASGYEIVWKSNLQANFWWIRTGFEEIWGCSLKAGSGCVY